MVSARSQNRNGFGDKSVGISLTPKAGANWIQKPPQSVTTVPATTTPPVVTTPVVTTPVVTGPQECTAIASNVSNLSTDFVMTVNTCFSETNASTLPLQGTYIVNVDWDDGRQGDFVSNDNASHTYASEGIYTVRICGSLQHF